MREGGEKFPFEVQKQRDKLAREIRDVRKERDARRKEAGTLKSKVLGRTEKLTQEAEGLNVEARRRLEKGKETIQRALESYRLDLQESESVGTDHNLIRWYYKHFKGNPEVHPVATDTFIDKSKEEYNAAWLSRELVQNFVDHNPKQPGTLNGVSVQREILEDGKTVRYTITGEWPLEDPTGIISPHSEKPTEFHTAGGNGIGLKQTAIRYLRDFGVKRFDIQGENWVASYELARADEINKALKRVSAKAKQPVARAMRHDWLIAKLKPVEQQGKVIYIIETDNPEVIAALDQLDNIGVSKKNEFLQNPDFVNAKGLIKWLPPVEGKEQRGRLFINGQVMNYGSKGQSAENYWVGPEYVTIQLNNISYKMSIDRPPVQSYELKMYISELIRSMTVEQILEQLQKSEPIWSVVDDMRAGGLVVVEALVNRLCFNSKYDKKDFEKYFAGKRYLARDISLTPAQEQDLQKQGYTLCPAYFERIGMTKAGSKLGSLELAANQRPNTFRANSGIEKVAEESGIQVTYEEFGELKPEQLLTLIRDRLASARPEIILNEANPNIIRIKLNVDLPKELLSRIISHPKTDAQKILHFLRGVAFYGLDKKIFKRIFLAQGEYVTTFDTQFDFATATDTLYVRNTKAPTEGVFVEFELSEKHARLREILMREQKKPGVQEKPAEVLEPKQPEEPAALAQEGAQPPKKKMEVVIKERELKLTEEQLNALERVVPGIKSAISQLEEATQKAQPEPGSTEKSRMEKYREWRDSEEAIKIAQENAGYINGKALSEIVAAYNQAEVPIAVGRVKAGEEEKRAISELESLRGKLETVINRLNPDGEIDDFEMVFNPEERQLAQLGLLRIYSYLATGAAIKNRLFLFRGTGARGINFGKEAIGIHEKELDQSFLEAYGIFTHELAHNEHMDHDVGFMVTMEALFLETNKKLTEIALKAKSGEDLTDDEETILSIVEKWDRLRNIR
jgi:hypothetical protein